VSAGPELGGLRLLIKNTSRPNLGNMRAGFCHPAALHVLRWHETVIAVQPPACPLSEVKRKTCARREYFALLIQSGHLSRNIPWLCPGRPDVRIRRRERVRRPDLQRGDLGLIMPVFGFRRLGQVGWHH
jgi:hypothetical protein